MAIDTEAIVDHFNRGIEGSHGRLLRNAACYLMRLILREHDFADMESLVFFCAQPDNLKAWLPTETDRIIFAQGLTEGLRDMVDSERQVAQDQRARTRTA